MKKVPDLEKYGCDVKREDAFPRLSERAIDTISGFFARAAEGYRANGAFLGHDLTDIFRVTREGGSECYGRPCSLPAGPGACPLTIDIEGIVSAYLSGARSFELPAQAAIARAISRANAKGNGREAAGESDPRPSMRVLRDFSLARFILLILGRMLFLDLDSGPLEPCVFTANVSAEIEAETEDFIAALRDGRALAIRAQLLEDFKLVAGGPDPFGGTDLSGRLSRIVDLDKRTQKGLIAALTVAVPDGLPLKNAEPRLSALISNSGLPVELKLGPWALGSERLSDILRRQGSERDPRLFGRNAATRYSDAIMTIRRLFTQSRERSSFFGLRIDGSLPAAIGRSLAAPETPDAGKSAFLSGPRSFAAGLSLAAKVSEDLSGTIPLSFSGGLDPDRAANLFKAGLRPLNVVTSLYSPEGARAIRPLAEALNRLGTQDLRARAPIDVRVLRDYAASVLG